MMLLVSIVSETLVPDSVALSVPLVSIPTDMFFLIAFSFYNFATFLPYQWTTLSYISPSMTSEATSNDDVTVDRDVEKRISYISAEIKKCGFEIVSDERLMSE